MDAQTKSQKNSVGSILFLLVIGAILVLPIIFFNHSNETTLEKRNLAMLPKFFNDGEINGNLFKELENYVNDRFGLRDFLVDINTKISLYVFKISPSDDVLIGKENWLFYVKKIDGDNLPDFLKINKFTDSQLEDVKNNLEDKADWCKKNGIKFLFIAPPSKHSIYPEYYSLKRPEGETRLDQLINYLNKNSSVEVVDLRPDLLEAKNESLLYRETDTHWNNNGTYCGYKTIAKKVKELFPDIDFGEEIQYDITMSVGTGGDLPPIMGVKEYGKMTTFDYAPQGGYPYIFLKDEYRNGIITEAIDVENSDLPKAIFFRDSFFDDLHPFVSTLFSKTSYIWKFFTDDDKESILNEKPDIVIFELLERYMDLLAQ